MDIHTAAQTLKLKLPTTVNAAKTAYKRRAREEHPDVSKHPEASERFRLLKVALDLLLDSDSLEVPETASRTQQGDLLKDLGKGLGPRTNGRPCDGCQGKGYQSHSYFFRKRCPDCIRDFSGRYNYRCTKCEGSGDFKRNGKIAGKCFRCNGSGWFTPSRSRFNNCRTCRGQSYVSGEVRQTAHNTCSYCKGTGELLVFNPVLPKGLLL